MSVGTHPCTERKDGARSVGVISGKNQRVGHLPLNNISWIVGHSETRSR